MMAVMGQQEDNRGQQEDNRRTTEDNRGQGQDREVKREDRDGDMLGTKQEETDINST